MALIIAGERSGVGKTTVTLALLAQLQQRSRSVQSFKVGPDYIDPMFHTAITQKPCRNLDPVLTSEQYVRQCFAQHSATAQYALIEGVMGLFDGASGTDLASTAHIARLLKLPIVLVVDCSRLSRSVAAIVHGYRSFDPTIEIAGVILNQVGSARHLKMLTAALAPLKIPIVGVLHRQDRIQIPNRHLGLVPTDELPELQKFFEQLADLAEQSFDWSVLLPLLETQSQSISFTPEPITKTTAIRIAIAQDAAFNFYYADNLELLQSCGAELIPWSPLADEPLPQKMQGVYLGGGFPEMFAAQLSQNQVAMESLKTAINAGLPVYAECGGLMYLCDAIVDLKGESYPMLGVLPTTATMQAQLTLGYRTATTLNHTLLVEAGQTVNGHEFHHSCLTHSSDAPIWTMRSLDGDSVQQEGWQIQNVHASYVHLHWGNIPQLPQRFVESCQKIVLSKLV